jgi:hypothetical protein
MLLKDGALCSMGTLVEAGEAKEAKSLLFPGVTYCNGPYDVSMELTGW